MAIAVTATAVLLLALAAVAVIFLPLHADEPAHVAEQPIDLVELT